MIHTVYLVVAAIVTVNYFIARYVGFRIKYSI